MEFGFLNSFPSFFFFFRATRRVVVVFLAFSSPRRSRARRRAAPRSTNASSPGARRARGERARRADASPRREISRLGARGVVVTPLSTTTSLLASRAIPPVCGNTMDSFVVYTMLSRMLVSLRIRIKTVSF